jgi:hypothetical protein
LKNLAILGGVPSAVPARGSLITVDDLPSLPENRESDDSLVTEL